jgi:hypothetical protein
VVPRLSPIGWGALAAAVVGVALGRTLGWLELAAAGAALAVVLVLALLMTVGRERYEVDLDLADRRVRVGERAVGRLTVRNASRRRSLPARIELPVGAGGADLALPSLAGGAEHDDLFAIPTSHRAVVVVGPVRSVRGDPLGLARRTQTVLALSTDPRDFDDDDELELGVSTIASIGVQTLREQRDLVVLAGPGRLRVSSPPRLLDDCSAVSVEVGGTGVSGLGRRIAREAPAASVAVLVTGSVPTPADLRAAARHVPVGTRTLVLTCSPGAAISVRTQGSLSIGTLGSLDDLPRVLRRVVG